MADVLIVCVREDEPQAKALADMFERAGFTVGGAPSNDGALRSSGAALVVWSQAAIRSRPFLDAAQRVVNAEKAVLACLIEPPPATSVNNSPAFDLAGWMGDPDDPVLDPLFFAVDRMVNSARAAVGASPATPAATAFEPPPNLRPPPNTPPYARAARTAPPVTRQPPPAALPPGFQMRNAPQPQQPPPRAPQPAPEQHNDPLGSEAEHWRAIRHSSDPTDFLDYLARYGPEGAFAELAEHRLKQLQPPDAASLRQAARAAAVEPPPQRALAPAPRREPAPAPPPRRRDPPPERLFETPRVYDTPSPEPKTGGGAALRALVLLLVLGGAAVGAGVYFGVGPEQLGLGGAPEQTDTADVTEVGAATPLEEPATAAEGETPVDFAALNPPVERAGPLRDRQQQQRDRERERERVRREQQAAAAAAEAPTPAPLRSWTDPPADGAATTGGPVSLVPNANAGSGASAVIPLPAPGEQVVASNNTGGSSQTAAPPPRGQLLWTQRPSVDRIAALYPRRAARDGVGGRVELDCTVRADLGLNCAVARESAPDAGFGRAALSAAASYRARSTLSDGASSAGTRTRIAITFRPPPNE